MSFLQWKAARKAAALYKAALAAAFLLYASAVSGENPGPGAAGVQPGYPARAAYVWPGLKYDSRQSIAARIAPPAGARRIPVATGSFAEWLRYLPLKAGRPAVRLYNGALKANQEAHQAVVDIDVGQRDLQQCADALMRLRAEYFFARGERDRIQFLFTDLSEAPYPRWARGYRPLIRARQRTRWVKQAGADRSYAGFREYLQTVFMYAGTYSLSRESRRVAVADLQIGDYFLQGGFPGHGVLVVDVAESQPQAAAGLSARRYFLLAQSYMPAQEIHVLRNPRAPGAAPSAWYTIAPGQKLYTPEWEFHADDLMRFTN